MNELVIMHNKQAVTTSLRVAEVFGKDHKHVLETISNLAAEKSAAKFFAETTYDNRGKQYPMYYMNRDGFTLLAMGFTGKKALQFKIKYIQAFNSMEATLKRLPAGKLDPVAQADLAVTRANTAKANALYKIACKTTSETAKQALLAKAAESITGEMTIPVLLKKEYSAGEVARKVHVSSGQMVGRIANRLGIKAEQPGQNEYGRWANSKSQHSDKEVPQWMYFEQGVKAIADELKRAKEAV
ncbi:Rha family transcriptional regulator [Lacticaseibacillus paracasei]|uniref:Rha family transcriptional regulator n=1 Tax=Lacticaseibacillus paracasei TaxID=1597 RepID=UPI002158269A|nr:Rha family transcriptional regulator [Lacticaseibacillus paracasei]UVD35715.1 Rha family transcriptional regulator [Lacticaseibacillus paracasei]UVD36442.1 Rha family transcriptional regulator [Lacticaseibacillus paracasei]